MTWEKLLELPEGWLGTLVEGRIIVTHPNHPPRVLPVSEIKFMPFEEWPELEIDHG